jgi:methyltransferase-like protein 6
MQKRFGDMEAHNAQAPVADETNEQRKGKGGGRKRSRKRKPPRTHMKKREQELRKTHAQRKGGEEQQQRIGRILKAVEQAGGDEAALGRVLTAEQADSGQQVEDEWQAQYRGRAALYWDHVYRNKTVNYFKDRHYFAVEFSELMSGSPVVLELGCGVGNSAFPLLEANQRMTLMACDLSAEAIDLMKAKEEYTKYEGRCLAFVCNILDTAEGAARERKQAESNQTEAKGDAKPAALEDHISSAVQTLGLRAVSSSTGSSSSTTTTTTTTTSSSSSGEGDKGSSLSSQGASGGETAAAAQDGEQYLDFITMVFVLSAIPPEAMRTLLQRMFALLKPGAMLLLRDYGQFDLAQFRFQDFQKMGDNFYVRGDGTMAYFFEQQELRRLFQAAGFEVLQCEYKVDVKTNHQRDIKMKRVWVQGKFRKPV